MIKRILVTVGLCATVLASSSALAQSIGVVDMRQIFQSPEVKQINNNLDKQFASQRNEIVALSKSLQANTKKLDRNESVMSKSNISSLKSKISKQKKKLRTSQMNFQKALFAAQNKAMNGFMEKLHATAEKVALKDHLDVVFPKNSVLYARKITNITDEIIDGIK